MRIPRAPKVAVSEAKMKAVREREEKMKKETKMDTATEDGKATNNEGEKGKEKSNTSKRPRVPHTQKLKQLRELILGKKTREEIRQDMNLTIAQFSTLYFELVQKDNTLYDIKFAAPVRKSKISENGFAVSLEKIESIGLEEDFQPGMILRYIKDGHRMVIEAYWDEEEETGETEEAEDEQDEIIIPSGPEPQVDEANSGIPIV